MKSPKKILVGVDLNSASLQALMRAASFAKEWEATVKILHVIPELPYQGSGSSVALVDSMNQLEEVVTKALDDQVQALSLEIPAQIEVRVGLPYLELVRDELDGGADLLVVGSRTKQGLEEILLGSTTEPVVCKSLVPTWVELAGREGSIQRILFPTDLSENSHSALQVGLEWARLLKAKPVFIHVAEAPYIPTFSLIDPHDYEKKMIDLARQHFNEFLERLPLNGLDFEHHVVVGSPAERIADAARQLKADLIILSTHGRSGLNYRLIGSVASKLLRHAPCHLLFLRPPRLSFSWLERELKRAAASER